MVAAVVLPEMGRFPEGEYEYCFEFKVTTDKADAGDQASEITVIVRLHTNHAP